MSLSLRTALRAVGHDARRAGFTSGFAASPRHLRDAIGAMQANPRMAEWRRVLGEADVDEDWCEEAQGITQDGERFIMSSNGSAVRIGSTDLPNPGWSVGRSPKALYRFRRRQYRFADDDVEEVFHLSGHPEDHLGDIDHHDGTVHCAIEPHASDVPRVLRVSARGRLGEFSDVVDVVGAADSGQGGSFPWCAVNPWNGLLYSCAFYGDGTGRGEVHGYHRDTGAWAGPERTIRLGSAVRRVQGGCFSPRGHLYLACDDQEEAAGGVTVEHVSGDHRLHGVRDGGSPRNVTSIRAFSVFTGAYLGRTLVDTLDGGGEELEGICYAPTSVGRRRAQIHVLLLDNHDLAKDNVFVKPYAAPDPSTV